MDTLRREKESSAPLTNIPAPSVPTQAAPPPREARVTLWALLGVWLFLVVAGAALYYLIRANGLLPGDVAISREVQEQRAADAVLTPLMVFVSQIGYTPWTTIIYVAAVAIPLVFRRWNDALLLALTVTADVVTFGVKIAVARPRPTADLVNIYRQVSDFSFPSGHVVHYVVFYGVICYFAWRGLRGLQGGSYLKGIVWGPVLFVSAALILLIGPSRVYLGAHWPSDALGGYLLGGAWLFTLLVLHTRWLNSAFYRRYWGPRPAAVSAAG